MVGFGKMSNTANDFQKRDEIFHLMRQKGDLETELAQLFEILSSNHVGMHEPLVDREGFPRNDIDVYQVRTTRHRIICLQNDHKSIMSKIEVGLHSLHAGDMSDAKDGGGASGERQLEPFARVSMVSPGSPAHLCGLQADDLVLEFGSVNKSNFQSMQDLAVVVRHSAAQAVTLVVRRRGRHSPLHLSLVPQPWSGQGLIGCQIDPLPADFVER